MIPVIIAAVGAAAAIYGQIKSAQDQEEAAQRQQELVTANIAEMRYRQAMNEKIIRDKNEEMEGMYRVRAAARGGGGHGIGDILRNQAIVEENIAMSRHELNYKARQMELGAQIQTDLYSDQLTASYIGAAGSLLTTGARIVRDYGEFSKQNSNTQGLPKG